MRGGVRRLGFNRVLRCFFAWRLVIVEASRCQGVDAWRRVAAWRCVAPLRTAAPKMVTSGVCGHLAMIQCMVAFTFIPPPPPPASQPTNQLTNHHHHHHHHHHSTPRAGAIRDRTPNRLGVQWPGARLRWLSTHLPKWAGGWSLQAIGPLSAVLPRLIRPFH
jgi:hypothetical protein